MSDQETTGALTDFEPQRSSVKISRNAKGQTQFEVKVYSDSNQPSHVDAAHAKATQIVRNLEAEFPWPTT